MAIVFQSTSVSAASAAAAGATAQSAIRDALVAHPSGAWTLVEEFDSAGGTVHWVVLKNTGSVSGTTIDFFVCIGRVTATGQIGTVLGEVYTQATHALSVFAPFTDNSGQNILADGSFAGSGAAPVAFTLAASIVPGLYSAFVPKNTPAATMRFVTMVDQDFAIININTTTIYIGALTDLIVPAPGLVAAVPIGHFEVFNTNAGNFGAFTRHPIDAAIAPMSVGFSHSPIPLTNAMVWLERLAVDTAVYLNPDRFQGNRVAASELAAIMYAGTNGNSGVNNSASKVGGLRGKFKGIRVATYPFAATAYDTIVVDGRKHIILSDRGAIGAPEFVTPPLSNTQIKYGYVFDTGVVAP